ncbi:MAG: YaaL family protein [Clostridia bacterium]
MHEEYIRENPIIEKTEQEKQAELIMSIIKTRQELEEANKNFEYAEGELIDYYTYQIKASRAKIDYLIKKAKKQGIVLDMIEQIEMRFREAI